MARGSGGRGITRRRLLYILGAGAAGFGVGRFATRPTVHQRLEAGAAHSRKRRASHDHAGEHHGPGSRSSDPSTPEPSASTAEVEGATLVRWSDPATWRGRPPRPGDVVRIDRSILLDVDAAVAGVVIGPRGALIFDPHRSRSLTSRTNVVVRGRLQMRPARRTVLHRLLITGANESAFRGGGMEVQESDVGVWVVDGGVLDAVGTSKTPWARAAGSIPRGGTSVTLTSTPSGWMVGDEVAITPTVPPTERDYHAAYDVATIRSIAGRTIRLSRPVAHPHPAVRVAPGRSYGAEVLNLTRNVRIEGRPGGRVHVFVHSLDRQAIRFVGLRHVGPRRGGSGVLGRYGLHFHLQGSRSRGSLVEGVVVRDSGNHAFVPHASDGITFRGCIAHEVLEEAYWWDPGQGNGSRGVRYERCVASAVRAGGAAHRLSGFWLGHGRANRAVGCVAVGVAGGRFAAGYIWPENALGGPGAGGKSTAEQGVWGFQDCIGHNNKQNGIFVWQNNRGRTVVDRFVGYHNGKAGVEHGAYKNVYRYGNSFLYGNGMAAVILHAVAGADVPSLELENVVCDGAGRSEYALTFARHALPAARPTLIRGCTFRGYRRAGIGIEETRTDNPDVVDVVDCSFSGNEFWLADGVLASTLVRVQSREHGALALRRADQSGSYRREWNARVTPIEPFA